MNTPGINIEIGLTDQCATEDLGVRLAACAKAGHVILLNGDIGMGKSVLARAFIRAYCQTDEDVPSPTFNLVQIYDTGPAPVFHFDLYRLESPDQVLELGIEEAFADGISLIEWPDRLGTSLPNDRLEINIMAGKNDLSRKSSLTGFGCWKRGFIDTFENETKSA